VTRVAVLVLAFVVIAGGGWFVFHKSPKPMSDAGSRLLELRRSHAIPVPDVRSQTLVDAKSTFDAAGLAWEVVGHVKGYHTNIVVAETPAPGTRLIDTGTPLVKLRLRASGAQTGAPQQRSSTPGTAVQVLGEPTSGVTVEAAPATTTAAAVTTTSAKVVAPAKTPAVAAEKTTPKAPAKAAPKKAPAVAAPKPVTPKPPVAPVAAAPTSSSLPPLSDRTPAFILPGGAHRERAGEMPLPQRADLLLRYLRAHKKLTKKVAHRWLVQHAWVTAGARFGWWHGAEALQTLIAADRLAESRWGVGYENEAIAAHALAFVKAHEVKG
jgi:hypothetical protein